MRNFLSSNVLLSLLNFQTRLRKDLSNRVSLDQISFVKRAPCVLTRDFFLFSRDGARQTGRAEAAACHNFVAEHDALPVIVAVLGEPIFFRFLPPEFSKPDRFRFLDEFDQ